jgi:hypothetical protein
MCICNFQEFSGIIPRTPVKREGSGGVRKGGDRREIRDGREKYEEIRDGERGWEGGRG